MEAGPSAGDFDVHWLMPINTMPGTEAAFDSFISDTNNTISSFLESVAFGN